jgi:hypothetical protein
MIGGTGQVGGGLSGSYSGIARMEMGVDESQPGVRRLCIAAITWPADLLLHACQAEDTAQLCLSLDAQDGTEMAFAPPGINEVDVVTRLTTVMAELTSARRLPPGLARLAFHVGITRIEGDSFAGSGPSRARALLADPDIRDAAAACPGLAIIMSDGLYNDLRNEGLSPAEWRSVPVAAAWVRCCFPASRPSAHRLTDV